jgi:hypothetical protein
MPVINIGGTIINFPDSAQSPNWAPPIIQFAEAVALALSSIIGPFDVSPQIYTMISNVNTNVALPSLAFPTANVRGATITFTVYRHSTGISGVTFAEIGTLEVIYNGSTWELSDEHTGLSDVTFSITNQGQVQFSSTGIPGAGPIGFIGYTAKALQQG